MSEPRKNGNADGTVSRKDASTEESELKKDVSASGIGERTDGIASRTGKSTEASGLKKDVSTEVTASGKDKSIDVIGFRADVSAGKAAAVEADRTQSRCPIIA